MRFPNWLKSVLLTCLLGALAWALTDRIQVGAQLSAVYKWVEQVEQRLGRIEQKLDRLLERK